MVKCLLRFNYSKEVLMLEQKILELLVQWFKNNGDLNYFDKLSTGWVIDGIYDLEDLAAFLAEHLEKEVA